MGRILFKSLLLVALAVAINTPPSFSQTIDNNVVNADPKAITGLIVGPAVSQGLPSRFWMPGQAPFRFGQVRATPVDTYDVSRRIAEAIKSLNDPNTGIAPSHWGHPGYQDAAFLYDKAVDALVFKAAGDERSARAVLDYFAQRIRIPMSEIRRYADANGIYGILKLYPSVDDPKTVGFVNAIDLRNQDREGRGQLEFWTTPGPLAFLVLAFLNVDRKEYLPDALKLGEVLLAMQKKDGGVTDGDRAPATVNTEPHMDCYSAFLMLYDVTHDQKWKDAADRAWAWFEANLYLPGQSMIFRAKQGADPSQVFATDAYSWTMAGRGGDRLPLSALSTLTDRMLRHSLSRVTLELPDGKTKTLTLVDFADVKDMRIMADRGGFHPMGSVEWIGGVILALQKNAVRFWEAGDPEDREKAVFAKALSEYFMSQALNSFYKIDGLKGRLSFYATGQWVETGHGWRTPYFYVKDAAGRPVVRGGSTVAAWPVLPLRRQNPFQLDDNYGGVYDAIPLTEAARAKAKDYLAGIVKERIFVETVPKEIAEGAGMIPELWRYNKNMFESFTTGDYYAAILWANKVVGNPSWIRMARDQEARKEREIGGLIDYPWGTPLKDANDQRRAIQRYPILNEVGAAMWGLAVSYFRIGDRMQAKAWVRTLLESVACHQIYAPNGPGYWNALVSWETNPGGLTLDSEMGELYREVLKEKGLTTGLPKTFAVKFEGKN